MAALICIKAICGTFRCLFAVYFQEGCTIPPPSDKTRRTRTICSLDVDIDHFVEKYEQKDAAA